MCFEISQAPVDDVNHGAARDVDGLIVHKVSKLIFRRILMQQARVVSVKNKYENVN